MGPATYKHKACQHKETLSHQLHFSAAMKTALVHISFLVNVMNCLTTPHLPIKLYTPMKHLKIGCQKHKIDSLLLSSRYMKNYMKTCLVLHPLFTETMKVVANLFKKKTYGKNVFIEMTYVVGTDRNEAITMCSYNICYSKKGNVFGNLH